MVQHMLIFDSALVEVKQDKAGMYVPKTKPKQSSFFGWFWGPPSLKTLPQDKTRSGKPKAFWISASATVETGIVDQCNMPDARILFCHFRMVRH